MPDDDTADLPYRDISAITDIRSMVTGAIACNQNLEDWKDH